MDQICGILDILLYKGLRRVKKLFSFLSLFCFQKVSFQRAGIVVWQVKLPLGTVVLYWNAGLSPSSCLDSDPTSCQCAWGSSCRRWPEHEPLLFTWQDWMEFLVPGLSLAQLWLLWVFGQQPGRWRIFRFLSLCLSSKSCF